MGRFGASSSGCASGAGGVGVWAWEAMSIAALWRSLAVFAAWVWKEAADPRRITAVFKFYPEDTAKLLEAAKSEGPSEPASVNVETWFPEELLTQAEVTGGDKLNGTAYSAKQFLQPPFTEGRFVHIDGSDFVIVEATAK